MSTYTQEKECPKASTSMSLLTSERALYVEGIGFLDQYGSYIDSLWEKGVVYFVRDYYVAEVERKLESGILDRPLVARLNALNSDIQAWEDALAKDRANHPLPFHSRRAAPP